MSEFIVAGFDDAHTAYLVRGALARMQDEIPIEAHGVAVVQRREAGTVAIREALDASSDGELSETFWKTLMGLVFSSPGTDQARDVSERLAAIGVDATFIADVSRRVREGTLAVAVIAGEAARDRIIGILQGFRAEITRTRLIGDDRTQWMDRLSGN